MLYYVYLSIAALLVAGQFTVNKLYQKYIARNYFYVLLLPLLTGLCAFFLFFAINGFKLKTNGFVVSVTFFNALVNSLYFILGIFAVKYGSVAIYSMFAMFGGMLIPYFYGVLFLKEQITFFTGIGTAILILAIILNTLAVKENVKTERFKFGFLCVAVLILNGLSSVLGKIHQINENAVPVNDFIIWISIFTVADCLIVLFVYSLYFNYKNKNEYYKVERANLKTIFSTGCVGLFHGLFYGLGLMLQLFVAKHLPASVHYPFITGGSVVFGTLIAFALFKEKPTVINLFSLILLMCGTILFVF